MPSAPRIATIDRLRGIAVMGILLMNVAGFAMPSGAYFNPYAAGTPSAADLAVWAAAFVLVDGKVRALFSILFGASMTIVIARAADAGEDPGRVHLRRMAVLALFGAAHWLIWPGDILLHYAIVGALALPFTTLGVRAQIRLALLLLAAQAAAQGWMHAADLGLRARALAPHAPADVVAQWQQFAAAVGIGTPATIAREVAVHRGPALPLLAAHAHDLVAGTPFLLAFDGAETLAYMLIGMAALSSGFLSAGWAAARYRRAAIVSLGIGLPLAALPAYVAWASGFDTLATFAASTTGGIPARPLLALGGAAVTMPWLAADGALRRRLGAVGRCAFTNYVATSLVMTTLCDRLGLFGRLGRADATLLVVPVWLAMLAWSAPWLARYRHGPLEWAWRSLARWRWQRFQHY